MVTVRYESAYNNILIQPFEIGLRHLKVAFCDGTQETLIRMAKERLIYRPNADENNEYKPLTVRHRIFHSLVGLGETVGYTAFLASNIGYKMLLIPFIIASGDALSYHPRYIKGCYELRTHMEEGGCRAYWRTNQRRNPFDLNVKEDPFYQEQSESNLQVSSLQVDAWMAKAARFSYRWPTIKKYPLPRDRSECADHIFTYINKVLNDKSFQKDPQAFMKKWQEERGTTEELRIPEDIARMFFKTIGIE